MYILKEILTMKNKIITLCTIISFLITTSVSAQDRLELELPKIISPQAEEDLGSVISPVRKGEKSPFTGLILSPRAVATIMAHYKFLNEQISLETEKVRQEVTAHFENKINELKIKYESDKESYRTQLESSRSDSAKYKSLLEKEISSRPNLPLWAGLSFAGGIGLTLLIIFASNGSSN